DGIADMPVPDAFPDAEDQLPDAEAYLAFSAGSEAEDLFGYATRPSPAAPAPGPTAGDPRLYTT
ncbi:manganese catalase family protein, partial [Actinoplanes sp. NPDC051633]